MLRNVNVRKTHVKLKFTMLNTIISINKIKIEKEDTTNTSFYIRYLS